MLLLLMAIAGLPVSAANTAKELAGFAGPGAVTVQVTPTEDATVTALNKEKLALEVQQMKSQTEPDPLSWLQTNAAILISTLVVVIGGLIGLFRWFGDRVSEREKRVVERFQSAVTALGDEKEGTRIGAAILLRTFLHPDYEQFHTQIFDLVVANLRLPRTTHQPEDPTLPQPTTPFSKALITVFKESFPLVRESLKKVNPQFRPESLDASQIQLDHAYLSGADLKQAWLPGASLRGANLYMTDLTGADLNEADLSKAYLSKIYLSKAGLRAADLRAAELQNAHLDEAYLRRAKLRGVDLSGADLRRAILEEADLSEVLLSGANLSKANLEGANLSGAILSATSNFMTSYMAEMDLEAANLSGCDLKGADLKGANLSGVNLEEALSLKDANIRQVIGLTKEQRDACKAKGAIIDEDSAVNSTQSTVSSSLQNKNAQATSAPPAQGSTPASDTVGSSAASSEQSSQS